MAKKTLQQRKVRMCDGKTGYASREAALATIHSMRSYNGRNGNVRAAAIRAYLCHCGKWHIGHTRRINWKYLTKILHPA